MLTGTQHTDQAVGSQERVQPHLVTSQTVSPDTSSDHTRGEAGTPTEAEAEPTSASQATKAAGNIDIAIGTVGGAGIGFRARRRQKGLISEWAWGGWGGLRCEINMAVKVRF